MPAALRSRLTVLAAVLSIASLVGACGAASSAWTFAPASDRPQSSSASSVPGAPSGPADVTRPILRRPARSPPVRPRPRGATASWSLVKKEPCLTTFECVTLAVPKDHFATTGGETWNVTFAIHRATGERKGTYVEITGGPGYADIPASDSYLDYYATSVTEAYDVVYMDQRGIGQSGPIQCTKAAATYYASPARPQVPAERTAAAAAAQTFAKDCIAEAGVAEADLPFYATAQAVEDLEAVRDYLGVDKMDLYGLSYGTQFVQTYAAAHPDRIATLYVDGPVDLTIDGPTYYVEAARSAEDTLIATLAACTADETCKSRRGRRGRPGGVRRPGRRGSTAGRSRSTSRPRPDRPSRASSPSPTSRTRRSNPLYYSYDRLLLQRAIAAASA